MTSSLTTAVASNSLHLPRAGMLALALLAAPAAHAGGNAHEPLQDQPGATTTERRPAPLLHEMFQDHAVVQRNSPIRVWGQAGSGQAVKVTLARKQASA